MLGFYVKHRRRALGLTRAELARRAHRSAHYIMQIEDDAHVPAYETQRHVAFALHVPVATLRGLAQETIEKHKALKALAFEDVPEAEQPRLFK